MHVIFVEPRFPANQREFVRGLCEAGATVTGIGEAPAEALGEELRGRLLAYEQVRSVVDEEALEKAVRRVQARGWVDRLEAVVEAHILPAAKVRSARVAVTRVDPETWVPPDPGRVAERATGPERDKALYTDEMSRPLPVGLSRDGEPAYADLDFFDGRKGGHMSISGISGVATKTSYALFFLRMLTAHPQIVGEAAANLRVLIFNVKGEDLLWLDRPNRDFDEEAAQGWAALGVPPEPFPSVRFWAPPRRRANDALIPDTGGRSDGVDVFTWSPREFVDEELELLQKKIAERLGFRLVDHRMELYGVAIDRER